MFAQIKQVGITYISQRYWWWFTVLLALMIGPQLAISAAPNQSAAQRSHSVMFVVGMPLMFLVPFLVGQAKMQFAHSRARLTPQFFPAHLAVLAAILLLLFAGVPLAIAWISGFEPLGLCALALAIGAPAIWGAQLNRFSWFLISMATFYSLMTDWGLRWWVIEAGQHWVTHAAIFLVGTGLVLAWLLRLCHLTEEEDDYLNAYQAILARRTGSEAVEQRRMIAAQAGRSRLMGRIGDWWHHQLGGYYGGSRAGLHRVLRYGFGTLPVEVNGLFLAIMIITLGVFLSRFSFIGSEGANFGLFFFFGQFSVLMPAQIAGELLSGRRSRMASELMLPISRPQLIDGLLAVAARHSITLWLMMNAALGAVIGMTNVEVAPRTVAMFLLLSAVTAFAAMALNLRLAVWPSRAKRMLVLVPSWFLMLPPLVVWGTARQRVGDWPFHLVAAVLLVAGAWLLYSARRAWLNLEVA